MEEILRLVPFLVLITFNIENNRSTLAVEKGKQYNNSQISNKLGRHVASGTL